MSAVRLPYRNTIKKTDDFVFLRKFFLSGKSKKMKQSKRGFKPLGFWYEFRESAFNWGEVSWGRHIYEVKVDTKTICKIS